MLLYILLHLLPIWDEIANRQHGKKNYLIVRNNSKIPFNNLLFSLFLNYKHKNNKTHKKIKHKHDLIWIAAKMGVCGWMWNCGVRVWEFESQKSVFTTRILLLINFFIRHIGKKLQLLLHQKYWKFGWFWEIFLMIKMLKNNFQ